MEDRIIKVRLSKDQIDQAVHYGSTVEKKVSGRPNYTGLQREGRYTIGALGHESVTEVLRRLKIRHISVLKADGKPDKFDIIVFRNGEKINVDIKTAGKPYYQRTMFPDAQFKKHTHDEYIGCRIHPDHVQIIAWATWHDVSLWEVGLFGDNAVQTRAQLFNKMRTIDTFFKGLELDHGTNGKGRLELVDRPFIPESPGWRGERMTP